MRAIRLDNDYLTDIAAPSASGNDDGLARLGVK